MDREPGTLDFVEWPEAAGDWRNEAAHRDFVRRRILAQYPEGLGYWVLAPRDQPEHFLGWVLLIPADARGPEVEIGWRLTHAVRGRGYASEAAARVLEHGTGELRLPCVVADIFPQNAPSLRVARRIGMRETGPCQRAPHLLRFEARA